MCQVIANDIYEVKWKKVKSKVNLKYLDIVFKCSTWVDVVVVTFHHGQHHTSISQTQLFREHWASRLSQVFSYQDFTWMGLPSTRDTTSMLRLYNDHCLLRTLHYTCVCFNRPSARSPASNDSSLTLRVTFIRWSCLLDAGSHRGHLAPPPERQVEK